jgi:hypothetical protein
LTFGIGIKIDAYQMEPLRKRCACRATTCSSPTTPASARQSRRA